MSNEMCMLCESIENLEQVKDLNNWIAEEKKDGERIMIIKEGDRIELINRRNVEKSAIFPELLEVSKVSAKSFILDGEVCSEDGKFNTFQHRGNLSNRFKIEQRKEEIPLIFYVFDILEYEGKNLTNLPLSERKKYLENFRGLEHIQVLDWFETTKEIKGLWEWVKNNEKEGCILKLKNSVYSFSRSKSWLKLKNFKEVEVEFSVYENNNAGVKMISQEVEVQVQRDSSDRVERIKEKIDRGEKVKILVQYLSKNPKTNKLRFPSTKEILI